MKRILIIEDDPSIAKGLKISMEQEYYRVETVADGLKGFETARSETFDCIILDLMLPGKSGEDICRELRLAGVQTPILMLTSKKEEMDKVLGLELGADDYVTKPFSLREVHARIKALMRRSSITKEAETITFDDIYINFKKYILTRSGTPVKLSAREFEILRFFIKHEGEVVTRDMLLDEVWGYDVFPSTRTVDTFILNLRKKIEPDPAHPKHLLTVHKAGYKFVK